MTLGVAEVFRDVQTSIEPKFLADRVDRHFQSANEASVRSCLMAGRQPVRLNFAEPDYLGLAFHPTIIDASIRALMDNSQSKSFQMHLQEDFECKIADFICAESAVFFQSAWSPLLNLLQCVCDSSVPVYLDTVASLSIRDAIKITDAQSHSYPRGSVDNLKRFVKKYGSGIIIVDAVSSVDGSIAPLREIAGVAEEFGCLLIVDESHSLGLYGDGRGLVNELGLGESTHFITANLTKTFCSQAGVILGSRRNINYIHANAKELRYARMILPQDIAKFSATLDVLEKDEWRRVKLHSNANYCRSRLRRAGFSISGCKSHIVNLLSSDCRDALRLYQALLAKGIVSEYREAPVAPRQSALIRFVINAKHNKRQIDELVVSIENCADEIK